jgi:hypothetical protein
MESECRRDILDREEQTASEGGPYLDKKIVRATRTERE